MLRDVLKHLTGIHNNLTPIILRGIILFAGYEE